VPGTCVEDPTAERYTGKDLDAILGLYDFDARYYDPRIGRFISPDPGSSRPEEPQTFNRYSYALNSPYKYVDPDGRAVVLANREVNIGAGGGHTFIVVMPTGSNRDRFRALANKSGQIVLGATRSYNENKGYTSLEAVEPRLSEDSLATASQLFDVFASDQNMERFEANVIEAFLSYDNNSLKYQAADTSGGKNSNAFTRGVLKAAGADSKLPSKWELDYINAGWTDPIGLPDATMNDAGGGGW
jgi:RHS repeat-associated protein